MKGKLKIPEEIKALDGRAINLSHPLEMSPVSGLSGPGPRLTFWTQGCSIRCTQKCLNPENLEMKFVEVVNLDRMVEFIEKKSSSDRSIEGITFCGGESFDQALSLAKVAWRVKELGLSVVTYTGYRYEDILLNGDDADMALLLQTDILIDGPYMESEASSGLIWRGSKNQHIICLHHSMDFIGKNHDWAPFQGIELNWSVGEDVLLTGFQHAEEAEELIENLKLHGIDLQKP